MPRDKHYNPAIAHQLQVIVGEQKWADLPPYLSTLTNAQFRTAGYLLGEHFAPGLSETDFWTLTQTLVETDSRAFLVTMLKTMAQRLSQGTLHLHDEGALRLFWLMKGQPVDVTKTLQKLLPELTKPEDIEFLLMQLGVEEGRPQVAALLRVTTQAAGYVLCRKLRYVEHERDYLVRVATFLVKRGDGLGFNMASFLRAYYGLEEVKGTFSLTLQPYQLARIESSFEVFCQVMSL